MNLILIICLILLTVSIVTAMIFWILTLVQLKKAASEAELIIKTLNGELKSLEGAARFLGGMTFSTVAKFLTGIIGAVLSRGIFKRKHRENETKS